MAHESMGCGEEIRLKKRVTRQYEMKLQGKATIKRFSTEGEFLGELGPFYNAVQADGFDEFIRLIAGTSAQHFTTAMSTVRLSGTSGGGSIFTQEGASVGPAAVTPVRSAPSAAMRWEWHDNSVDTYDPDFLHFVYDNDLDGYVFAIVDISAAGSKPADENWHYAYELELYSTDEDFQSAGFDLLLDLMVGNSALHLTSAGIRLRPTTGAGSGSDVGSDLTPDGNPTVDTAANSLTWVWTVADGVSNGSWAGTKVKVGTSFNSLLRWGGCKTDGTSCGTKGSGEEWTYTYIFTVSAGSAP